MSGTRSGIGCNAITDVVVVTVEEVTLILETPEECRGAWPGIGGAPGSGRADRRPMSTKVDPSRGPGAPFCPGAALPWLGRGRVMLLPGPGLAPDAPGTPDVPPTCRFVLGPGTVACPVADPTGNGPVEAGPVVRLASPRELNR